MSKLTQGMAHYHDQEKDRQNWHSSVHKRTKLIERLRLKGIKPEKPHEMKISALKELLKQKR